MQLTHVCLLPSAGWKMSTGKASDALWLGTEGVKAGMTHTICVLYVWGQVKM